MSRVECWFKKVGMVRFESVIFCHCYAGCRLAWTESELVLAEQKLKDAEILLEHERGDKDGLTASYRTQLKTAQQVAFMFFHSLVRKYHPLKNVNGKIV